MKNQVRNKWQTIKSQVKRKATQAKNGAVSAFRTAKRNSSSAVQSLASNVESAMGRVKRAFEDAASRASSLASDIVDDAESAASQAQSAFNDAKEWAQDAADAAADAMSNSNGGGGGGGNTDGDNDGDGMVDNLGFASGGLVTDPVQGIVGEGQEHEAVLPLSELNSLLQSASQTGAQTAVEQMNLAEAAQYTGERGGTVTVTAEGGQRDGGGRGKRVHIENLYTEASTRREARGVRDELAKALDVENVR